jgi:hypothetical protein
MIADQRPLTNERDTRDERFQELLREVLPKVRSMFPLFSDEELLETAAKTAAYRLSDAAFVWVER